MLLFRTNAKWHRKQASKERGHAVSIRPASEKNLCLGNKGNKISCPPGQRVAAWGTVDLLGDSNQAVDKNLLGDLEA